MKRAITIFSLSLLALLLTPAVHAQNSQVMQGTQIWLVLQNGLSTGVARSGDPFTAVVSQPVYLGSRLLVPAGARVQGIVTDIDHPKRFALFRGGASMSLHFTSIEIEGRVFPARMSLLGIYKSSLEGGKARKDISEVEGVAVEEKRDIKGYIKDATIGTAGGSLAGLVFSHVVRGFGIGAVGSAAYIAVKRGKDVVLPAQTNLLVRLDNSIWVPAQSSGGYSSGMR